MIKIAICDDEKNGQKGLREMIRTSGIFDDAQYYFFESGQALIHSYHSGDRYGFVFLDVDMPGVNGIETGICINEMDKKSIIIFHSAYPQFAIDAFECNAFHYIVKGIEKEKFIKIITRAYNKYKRMNENLIVKHKDGIITLQLSDIYYVEYLKKHIIIHTENDSYEIRETMANMCEKLSGFGFYLCHQSFIVNFEKVKQILKKDIVLSNGAAVMLSTRKRSQIISAYNNYIENFVL